MGLWGRRCELTPGQGMALRRRRGLLSGGEPWRLLRVFQNPGRQ